MARPNNWSAMTVENRAISAAASPGNSGWLSSRVHTKVM